MSKILSLDLGRKRIGAALSDETKIIAIPYRVLNFAKWEEELKKALDENDIEMIVIGLPRKMDGSVGEKAEEVMEIGKKIQDTFDIKIEYEDETATSLMAEKRLKERGVDIRKNKGEIDKESAAIILESYLQRKDA